VNPLGDVIDNSTKVSFERSILARYFSVRGFFNKWEDNSFDLEMIIDLPMKE
jgi:hypothetical protein